MKLTWFGGTTLRIHIGGSMLVADPAEIGGVDAAELASGADRVFRFNDDLPTIDPANWQPRRPSAPVEEAAAPDVLVRKLKERAILLDAPGEPPLLLLAAPVGRAGRWSRDAVVVAFSPDLAARALDDLGPRLIALALPDRQVEDVVAALRDRLAGTGLVALEPGMALEV